MSMSVVAWPMVDTATHSGHLRPLPGRRAARFRRRRAAVAITVAITVALTVAALAAVGAALGRLGEPPPSAGAAPAVPFRPVARASYVVQPGDTLWQIARSLQPSGDVRPLVHRLAEERHGAPLRTGERLVLPPR